MFFLGCDKVEFGLAVDGYWPLNSKLKPAEKSPARLARASGQPNLFQTKNLFDE
jgi:hypothetical protein